MKINIITINRDLRITRFLVAIYYFFHKGYSKCHDNINNGLDTWYFIALQYKDDKKITSTMMTMMNSKALMIVKGIMVVIVVHCLLQGYLQYGGNYRD